MEHYPISKAYISYTKDVKGKEKNTRKQLILGALKKNYFLKNSGNF